MFLARIYRAVAVCMALVIISGCSTPENHRLLRFEFQQPQMGTLFTLIFYAGNQEAARVAANAAFDRISELDRLMSDYDPESELMRLCRQPHGQPVAVSPDLFEVLSRGQSLAERTDGAFDMTIGPIVRQWRRARRAGRLPSPEQLKRAMMSVGWQKLKLDRQAKTVTLTSPEMQLDLGGIAKGYAADQALNVLRERGITRALVAASGDIAIGDAPPGERGWRVAIGTPRLGESSVAHTLVLKNAGISTSGDAEQFVEIEGVRYSHIVDPQTGIGLTNQLQVTVVGRNAGATDSLATAASVLGVQAGFALIEGEPGTEGCIWQLKGNDPHFKGTSGFSSLPATEQDSVKNSIANGRE